MIQMLLHAVKTEMRYSIEKPDRLELNDAVDGVLYGCDQDWFYTSWQRQSGCGPSVASNILLYFHRSGRIDLPVEVKDKTDFIKLMENVWKYVTPTSHGLFILSQFCGGVNKIIREFHSSLQCDSLKIPKLGKLRPDFSTVTQFILAGLNKDAPVAFLNLSNGSLNNLDKWHWVTVIALDNDDETNTTYLEIFDNSRKTRINLTEWYATTTHGGGFVYFA